MNRIPCGRNSPPPLPPKAPRHDWLDVVGPNGKVIPCENSSDVLHLIRSDWFGPGRYCIQPPDGTRVADLYVDGPGHWRIYSVGTGRSSQ